MNKMVFPHQKIFIQWAAITYLLEGFTQSRLIVEK